MVLKHDTLSRLYRAVEKSLSTRSLQIIRRPHVSRQGDHLFSYTSGRWLWNETQRLDRPCRRFSVSDLIR